MLNKDFNAVTLNAMSFICIVINNVSKTFSYYFHNIFQRRCKVILKPVKAILMPWNRIKINKS